MKVSVTKSKNHSNGVLSALKLQKEFLIAKLSTANQIVIKINLVIAENKLSTTPFESVKTFIEFINPFYKGEIIIAEEPTIGDTYTAFKEYGFTTLEKDYKNVVLLDLGDDKVVQKEVSTPNGKMILPMSKVLLDAPFLVSICRAKTHDRVVVTLGIKNVAVGVIKNRFVGRSKVHQGKDIHPILTEISKIIYPDFVIIDGTEGMEGNGPDNGTPINSEWVVCSSDALAADSIAAHLMGFQLSHIGYFNLLKKADLGLVYPRDKKSIDVEGDYDIRNITSYKPHATFELQKEWR
jgi:uncharacterized protein (DUF362 family)